MRALLHRLFPLLGCLSLLMLVGPGHLTAADGNNSKRVQFTTFDEVDLSGTFYRSMPAAGNRDKDAVVLLLHDFSHAKGGGSKEAGWIQLAGELQKEGYSVLSFDFRGFGNSKTVNANKFWRHPHNQRLRGARRPTPPASIDQKSFPRYYYSYLVNDIAAARAYLNTMNDAGQVNASNIFVIGAGQGATLGALWMASECKRQKDTRSDNLLPLQAPTFLQLDDPEGNDLAAAVWLTISPKLEGRYLGGPLTSALVDTANRAKIPTYFLYAKDDQRATNLAKSHLRAISGNGRSEQKGVKDKAVPGVANLAGSKLLKRRTIDYIIKYLNSVIDERGTRLRKNRADQKFAFCWSLPWPSAPRISKIPAKLPGEPVPHIIPAKVLGLGR